MKINFKAKPYYQKKWFDALGDLLIKRESYYPFECVELNEYFCKKHNKKYAITCNSGTTGIWASLVAIGIQPEDEVIIPNFGFPAAFNCVQALAKPVPVDIDKKTLGMNLQEVKNAITPQTKAVIHIESNSWVTNEILELKKICHDNNLIFIEDSCPSFGMTFNNQFAGSFGDISIFSFSLHKPMFAGEGGLVLTDNKEWYNELQSIRYNDYKPEYKKHHHHNLWFSNILAEFINLQVQDQNFLDYLYEEKIRIHNEYKKYFPIYECEGVSNNYILATFFPDDPILIGQEMKKFFDIELRVNPYPSIEPNMPVSNWASKHQFDLPCIFGISETKIIALYNTVRKYL